jgi:hypothetical protein
MSIVETKNWQAYKHQAVEAQGATLLISGDVTIAGSAVEVSLVVSRRQDRSNNLNVDLVLEEQGPAVEGLTEKSVSLSLPGHQDVPFVHIIHEKKIVATIATIALSKD